MAIAADTRVAVMPADRAVLQVRLAADMQAEHADMRLREAAARLADTAAAHAAGLAAAVMPVAAAMGAVDTGN